MKSTLLLKAAPFNNRAVVEVLIASGADVTARDSGSLTPLHGAAQYQRDAAVFEVLIAARRGRHGAHGRRADAAASQPQLGSG